MQVYECVIVGAGPAGMAYNAALKNRESVLMVEMGRPVEQRERLKPEDCVQGAGGAGLFSDGKFSFYPSGTKIWEQEQTALRRAYAQLEASLTPFKQIPPFPEIKIAPLRHTEGWSLKPYPSLYFSFEERLCLIKSLAARCLNIRYETEFLGYFPWEGHYRLQLRCLKTADLISVVAKRIVFAGGRFMPFFLNCPKNFLRYEVGFRVEGPDQLVKKREALIDPKFILNLGEGVECRTFCWCENGEAVQTRFKEITTYSGRADCPPTGKSNFGFNFQIKTPSLINEEEFKKLIETPPYEKKWEDVAELTEKFPPSLTPFIVKGLERLQQLFPSLKRDAIVLKGPTIEGVGLYPKLDACSRLEGEREVYVIGDGTGLYRGIVASMLSGYLLANKHI